MKLNFLKHYTFIFLSTLSILGLVFSGCGGSGSDGPKIGEGTSNNTSTTTSIDDSAGADVAAELGGAGFAAIAAEQGWQTNTDAVPIGSPNAKKGGTFTMAVQEFPAAYRYIGKNSNYQVISIMTQLIYETLLGFDGETMEYTPGLATHWKISEDKTEYMFRLNPMAKWSDGVPITSKDIVATYKLLIDEGLEDPYQNSLYSETFEVPEVVSDYIFKVKTKKENWRSFLYFATSTFIYPEHYLNKTDGAGFIKKYQYDFTATSGPYQLDKEDTKTGEVLVIKRRDDYWGKDLPSNQGAYNFDKIKFSVVREQNLQMEKLKAGELDWWIVPRAQWWAEVLNEEYDDIKRGVMARQKIYNYNPKGLGGFALNTKREPFDDIKVRQAMSYLFNFNQLNEKLFFNEYARLNSYFPFSAYANPNNAMPTYDPTKALALLKEAGWTKKPGKQWLTNEQGEEFILDISVDKSLERIIVPYQEDLKRVGIQLKFNNVDPNERFKKLRAKDFTINFSSWTGLFFPNPENSMHSKFADIPDNNNVTGLSNKRIDELCELYDKSYDAQERVAYIQEIDSIANAQHHWVYGWTSLYTLRMCYWNKFGMPEKGISYAGDFESVLAYWWVDPAKEAELNKAIKDKSASMKPAPSLIDYWNLAK